MLGHLKINRAIATGYGQLANSFLGLGLISRQRRPGLRSSGPPDEQANRGQMSRLVLMILRQARRTPHSREIAEKMLLERAMDTEDTKWLNLMVRRVGSALRYQWDKGRTASRDGPGNYVLWEGARG